ncbi:hypothetical protein mRhiFer1_007816 [Rhinolophus ferrumequinum]|uniref:Uncharacterized protein n=1 Tax=Rhinolophus ferrumequinum TaxID=59479 RepID=A0A7J8AVK5_RHIFE|nr:hypothetical protein mRhiFer1_007816 [Rhinolophus ferrumequinum]
MRPGPQGLAWCFRPVLGPGLPVRPVELHRPRHQPLPRHLYWRPRGLQGHLGHQSHQECHGLHHRQLHRLGLGLGPAWYLSLYLETASPGSTAEVLGLLQEAPPIAGDVTWCACANMSCRHATKTVLVRLLGT